MTELIEVPWSPEKKALVVDGVLSPEECQDVIERVDAVGWSPSPMAPMQSGLRSRLEDAQLAEKIFTRLRPEVPEIHMRRKVIGLTSTLRFVKYQHGAEVLPHPDTAGGDKYTPVSTPHSSLFTCLLYLNEGYQGCETHLLPLDKSKDWPGCCQEHGIKIIPKIGRVFIFEHDLLHGCPPLISGASKIVSRLDLVYETHDYLSGKYIGSPYIDSTLHTKKKKHNLFTTLAKAITKPPQPLAADEDIRALLRGATAVVTGASSGIGLALCHALSKELEMNVIAVARSETCTTIASEDKRSISYFSLDVTDEAASERFMAEYQPTVLINNAGITLPGAVVRNGNQTNCNKVFQVNTLAPLHWSRLWLKHLERRRARFGHLINISSLSAHRIASTELAVYAASKHALKALTEATRLDLRKAKLPYRVSMVSPGLVDTPFFAHSFVRSPAAGSPNKKNNHHEDDDNQRERKATHLIQAAATLSPAEVVQACLFIMTAPPSCEVHDILLRPTESRD